MSNNFSGNYHQQHEDLLERSTCITACKFFNPAADLKIKQFVRKSGGHVCDCGATGFLPFQQCVQENSRWHSKDKKYDNNELLKE